MGKLTTHILDTSIGKPANEVEIKIYRRNDSSLVLIKSAKTNEDGRCDEPLLSGDEFLKGCYEIEFIVDQYYEKNAIDSPFLKDVVLRFYISNSDENYHVPLLISPFGYSTYRGS